MRHKLLTILPLLALSFFGWCQDTVKYSLPEVNIIQRQNTPNVVLSQTPTQVVTVDQIEKLGDATLSDAVKRMAGVTLKDYGGVGGIKTVSVRGLGSQFSTLTVDGVAVTDCQNGQVDLGRYTLGNSGFISLANGQPDSKLNSARAYAAGSIVNMETAEPMFGGRTFNLQMGMEGGSFGYLSPTLAYQQRLGKRSSLSLWSNYTCSEGNYPFTLYYTPSHTDSSSREYRENSQVRIGTFDVNYFFRPAKGKQLMVKVHYMQGYHALPGPVVYYTVRGSEHSEEHLFFAQTRYYQYGRHWDLQFLGKHQQGTDIYEDTAARNSQHLIHNDYSQQEEYLSQTIRFHTGGSRNEALNITLALDESLNQLQSNLSQHNDVMRLSALGVLGLECKPEFAPWLRGVKVKANMLSTWVCDYEAGEKSAPYSKISPYIGLSWPIKAFVLRYYYKDSYRVPNFNELYYFTIGHELKPEKAMQHNLGATYQSKPMDLNEEHSFRQTATLDMYRNHVSDKIIAFPTNNMYLWTMKNLGEVEIWGADITYTGTLNGIINHQNYLPYDISLSLGYTYQYAVDRTDPGSKFYGHQIPYTPRHSGNITLVANTPWVDIGLTTLLTGKRYSMQQNTADYLVKGYVDQGITLSHKFYLKHTSLTAKVQVLNILDIQYEVVKNYPMMGRNYRVGITWNI